VHTQRSIRLKLTNSPKSEAARELLALSKSLTKMSKSEFVLSLNLFENRHYLFLNEKSLNDIH